MTKIIRGSPSAQEKEEKLVRKFLTFTLGEDVFAIDLPKIQEIKNMEMTITKILDAPPYLLGMVHFHDIIIPIINLRIFFHLKPNDTSELNALIIISIQQTFLGIVVDSVSDIIELQLNNIKPAPDFFSIIHHDYVDGIGELNEQLITIINVDKLVNKEDLQIPKSPIKEFKD